MKLNNEELEYGLAQYSMGPQNYFRHREEAFMNEKAGARQPSTLFAFQFACPLSSLSKMKLSAAVILSLLQSYQLSSRPAHEASTDWISALEGESWSI
jgi:hypothetical protein